MNSFTNTYNFDNLVALLGRLQLSPPNTSHNPLLSQSHEDHLFDAASNYSVNSDDGNSNTRTQLCKEEFKLKNEIEYLIDSGRTDSLKPNSGEVVQIGEHQICVRFHEEKGSDYRAWEWQGHVMLFNEETGYSPEYTYGHYYEMLEGEEEEGEEKEEEKMGNWWLRELIFIGILMQLLQGLVKCI
ncbi:uncharacterized protein LOC110673085 [Hevea brasiliensis]|uniref:uncharacterized protein LOC110673085 n=1 Tax=Hevea brasiliensis TaxID=3981 RepID=UPI0025CBF777|nr:uncharacterized protein LOC110673085 [Hevea brasiliensis]